MMGRSRHLMVWWSLFVGLFSPAPYIFYLALSNQLGAEPAKALVEFLGEVAFIILILTLSITPLKRLSFLPSFVRYRRMVGLYVFFYALLHVLSYGLFLVDWANFVEDLYKRPYVVAGALGFLILFALAITSLKVVVRKMGKNWKRLHRSIYLSSIAILIHVYWQTRADYLEAILFAVPVFIVLLLRAPLLQKKPLNLSAKQST